MFKNFVHFMKSLQKLRVVKKMVLVYDTNQNKNIV